MNREALIATAAAFTPHVLDWVDGREPLGCLIGNRTWEELAAALILASEALAAVDGGRETLEAVCAAAVADSGIPRGRSTRHRLPDDGVVDDLAVARAVAGRPVRLSPPELRRAAERIVADGGRGKRLMRCLRIDGAMAGQLLAEITGQAPVTGEDTGEAA